ncbi:MAG: hypothetical protein US77_C0014G0003 [Microgenomates group bacterium GW2011_GWC1_38_14]|nr:MAG: hypothetical protein US77_C0014G0003 [Microgenomates group bacterium GW2011_GWC1_38_14]
MRSYELVLVLKTSLKEGDRKKITGSLKDLIGKNFSEKEMGQLPLSYPIKKEVSKQKEEEKPKKKVAKKAKTKK